MIETVLPNGMVPYPHQIQAAHEALQSRRFLFAHDVGAGKTLSAILAARTYQQQTGGKVLIVAPASLLTNWEREIDGLLDGIIVSAGKVPIADDFGDDKFYLISDEAHYYQNTSSKRTQKMVKLAKAAQGVLLLTATPIRNYPSNIFPLLKMMGHDLGKNFEAFKRQYCGGSLSGSSNLMELNRRIQTQMIVGDKKDYLDLPPFKRILKQIELHGVGRIMFDKMYYEKRAEYREKVKNKEISKQGFHIVLINHLRMATSIGKSFKAIEIAKSAIENGHQVAIFTNFNQSANLIDRWLDEYGSEMLNGAVPKGKRQGLVDTFQSGKSKVFVMTKAGSAGLNLQKGTVFISVDRTWSPFDMVQAEGRIHRNGQEHPCYSIWLQDSIIDPYLDGMMLKKYAVAREVLHGRRDTMDGLGNPGKWARDLSSLLFGRE